MGLLNPESQSSPAPPEGGGLQAQGLRGAVPAAVTPVMVDRRILFSCVSIKSHINYLHLSACFLTLEDSLSFDAHGSYHCSQRLEG